MSLLAALDAIDRDALAALDAVQANPGTARGFAILGQFTHLPPEMLATGVDVLEMILKAVPQPSSVASDAQPAPQDAPQAAPTGPVTGGVA